MWRVVMNACCAMMMAQQTIMMRASQNGKKPLFGPSMPQPTPRRIASTMTRPPRRIRIDAVMRSAARMLLFYQPFFHHQVTVELFVFFDPFDVLRAGKKSGLQSAI